MTFSELSALTWHSERQSSRTAYRAAKVTQVVSSDPAKLHNQNALLVDICSEELQNNVHDQQEVQHLQQKANTEARNLLHTIIDITQVFTRLQWNSCQC